MTPKNIAQKVSVLKSILGWMTQAEADARYPQISEGDPTPIYTADEVDAGFVKHIITDAVRKTHTGTTAETQISSVTVPVVNVGLNGEIRIKLMFDGTSSAAAKTYILKLNGTVVYSQALYTTSAINMDIVIANQNSNTNKRCFGITYDGLGLSPNASINSDTRTLMIDTSSAIVLTTHITLGDGANSGYQDFISVDTVK